jgi:hypothetical protein
MSKFSNYSATFPLLVRAKPHINFLILNVKQKDKVDGSDADKIFNSSYRFSWTQTTQVPDTPVTLLYSSRYNKKSGSNDAYVDVLT